MRAARSDQHLHTPAWLTVPNALTFMRILLTPLFGYLWWRHRYGLAIVVFAIASVSDVLDGLLARILNQRSRLGQILDPTADKIMVGTTFIAAAATGALPRWLAAIVIGRDLVLALGGALFGLAVRGVHGPERWHPTRIGKYATFFTVGTIGLALTWQLTGYEPLRPFVGALGVMSAATTIISGMQYIVAGVQSYLRSLSSPRSDGA